MTEEFSELIKLLKTEKDRHKPPTKQFLHISRCLIGIKWAATFYKDCHYNSAELALTKHIDDSEQLMRCFWPDSGQDAADLYEAILTQLANKRDEV